MVKLPPCMSAAVAVTVGVTVVLDVAVAMAVGVPLSTAAGLTLHRHHAVCEAFKGVVVADHKELIEVTYAPDLLREVAPPLFIHIGRRLVEEGDAHIRQLFQQRQPHRERGGHLFAARKAGE